MKNPKAPVKPLPKIDPEIVAEVLRFDAELSAHEKIVAAATTFVQAHKEDYELLKTSNSMDVDVEFMELCDAVLEFKPDAPAIARRHLP